MTATNLSLSDLEYKREADAQALAFIQPDVSSCEYQESADAMTSDR